MTPRRFLDCILVVLALAAGGAALADAADDIAAQLREEGYVRIQIERTLLGRIRITAENETTRREIVIDRGTGEILRDLSEERQSALPGGAAAMWSRDRCSSDYV